MNDKDFEEAIAFIKDERNCQRGPSPTAQMWMRFILTPVFIALSAFLWYLGVTGDSEKEIALAATNGGTAIGILVASHWFPQLAGR